MLQRGVVIVRCGQIDVDDAVGVPQPRLAEIAGDLQHRCVAGQHVAVQGGDAVPAGGGPQLFQQQRTQAAAVRRVVDEDREVGPVPLRQPLVGGDRDDPAVLQHDQREVVVVGGPGQPVQLLARRRRTRRTGTGGTGSPRCPAGTGRPAPPGRRRSRAGSARWRRRRPGRRSPVRGLHGSDVGGGHLHEPGRCPAARQGRRSRPARDHRPDPRGRECGHPASRRANVTPWITRVTGRAGLGPCRRALRPCRGWAGADDAVVDRPSPGRAGPNRRGVGEHDASGTTRCGRHFRLAARGPRGAARPAARARRRGSGADPSPGVPGSVAAVQRRLPGGGEHPGVAGARAGGAARAGVAGTGAGQPVSGHPREGVLPPLRERVQPCRPGQRRVDPWGRAVPGRPGTGARLAVSIRHRASSGRRVLVVGAGPSGLSAAYHLARLGHQVEIRDASPEPGGMMRYGIPAYRLPRDVLAGEIDRIAALGVRITCGHRVEDLVAERREGGFDAVFVAVGAHLSKRVDIPAREAGRIVDAVSFLRGVASGERPVIGRRVAVYGGGNTAMDAARVARRLGAEDALIVYRRTRRQMPAHAEEAQDAEREGVRINWLRTIAAFDGPELTVEVMELDPSGRPQGTGRFETLAADTVILALGQDTDTAFLRRVPGVEFAADGTVVVSTSLMTGAPGVFAGGDMVPSERTVTVGVGHGKKAARHIDAYLRDEVAHRPAKHDVVTFDALHPWYFGDAARRGQPELDPAERVTDFTEVVGGLDVDQATYEAGRCLSCGNCFECDGCLGACPEDAVIKLGVGHRYRFDYDRCTGCGTCFEQCPVHAIEMVAEDQ